MSPDAAIEEINHHYRDLVKLWHPDHNRHRPIEAEQHFIEIQAAYETLTRLHKMKDRAHWYKVTAIKSQFYHKNVSSNSYSLKWDLIYCTEITGLFWSVTMGYAAYAWKCLIASGFELLESTRLAHFLIFIEVIIFHQWNYIWGASVLYHKSLLTVLQPDQIVEYCKT